MAQSKYPTYKFEEDPLVLRTRDHFFDLYIKGINQKETELGKRLRADPVLIKSWAELKREKGSEEYNRIIRRIKREHPMMGAILKVNSPGFRAPLPIGYQFVNIAGAGGSGSSIYLGVRNIANLTFEIFKGMITRKELDISDLHVNQLRYLEQVFQSEAKAREFHEYLTNLPIERKIIAAKVLVDDNPMAQEDAGPSTLKGASALDPTLDDITARKLEKIQNGKMSHQEKVIERFAREGEILRNLDHPHIVRVFNCGNVVRYMDPKNREDPRRLFFYTMEFLPKSSENGLIPPEKAVPLAIAVGEGLVAMHDRGIIHRDIKSQNVMFDAKGIPKVTDPGIAKRTKVEEYERTCVSLTEDGQAMGTPYYMPPEQIENSKRIDFRADVYSLGMTLYRWVSGMFAYDFSKAVGLQGVLEEIRRGKQIPLSRFIPKRNKPLEWVIMKAIEKDPCKRFQTMREFVDALKKISQ
ncbi:serine/threonine protein kinase [Candidatus Woesearchaeota archaeon]|nr:serine/threonine protein kinase [Candidatus Woesearchaeota archaeon]